MDALARHCDARFDRLRGEPGGAALCSAAAVASGALGAASAAAATGVAAGDGVGCADESRQARQDLPQARLNSPYTRAQPAEVGWPQAGARPWEREIGMGLRQLGGRAGPQREWMDGRMDGRTDGRR